MKSIYLKTMRFFLHIKYESQIKLEAQGLCPGHRSIIAILYCFYFKYMKREKGRDLTQYTNLCGLNTLPIDMIKTSILRVLLKAIQVPHRPQQIQICNHYFVAHFHKEQLQLEVAHVCACIFCLMF